MYQRKFSKLISALLCATILTNPVMVTSVYALDAPESPQAPDRPDRPAESQIEPTSDAPDRPDRPDKPESPHQSPDSSEQETTSSPAPTSAPNQPDTTANPTPTTNNTTATNEKTGPDSNNHTSNNTNSDTTIQTDNNAQIDNALLLDSATGRNYSDKNTGDTSIKTGDSNIVGQVQNQANNSSTGIAAACSLCVTNNSDATNRQTGADSQNTATNHNDQTVYIENNQSADLDNGIIALSDTGLNSASKNTGNAEIQTGDSNVGLTVVNLANTNITGVSTSEYNVYDDHRGDIVLDFASLGANSGNAASNSNTGADSQNDASNNANTAMTIVNNNDASVASELVIDAETGNNSASMNTGDASINTGDANVVANVVNLVNNTLAAGTEVIVNTINIFGDMVGDIILTDSSQTGGCQQSCSTSDSQASNINTGSDSYNIAGTTTSNTQAVTQNNQADIDNGMNVNANTGGNRTDKNTGEVIVETGEVNLTGTTTNVANNNQVGGDGGTWWMVIVNEAGNWIGHIYGKDDHDNVASGGTVNLGSVNETTGAQSDNQSQNNSTNTTDITQNNNATIGTQITVNADTGNNYAEKNTGDVNVDTGDVNVASNIVNFINNNFVGQKVVISFVNIFGSLTGNIATPDIDPSTINREQSIKAPSEIGGSSLVDDQIAYQNSLLTPTPSITYIQNTAQTPQSQSISSVVAYRLPNYVTKSSAAISRQYPHVVAYTVTAQEAERIAQGQWIVQEDSYLTVTPRPMVLGAMNTDDRDPFNSLYIGVIIFVTSLILWQTKSRILQYIIRR